MNYPPYHLSQRARKGIFYLFTGIFLCVAPTVALYAAGYRFSLNSLEITRIGVLSVDTLPNDANVFFNNKLVATRLPLKLSNIIPGTYNLRLEKEGYLPWGKDIVIEENKTTYIKNFSLFLLSEPEAIEKNDALVDIFPSHDGSYLLEKFENPNFTQFTLFATIPEQATEILRSTSSAEFVPLWSERNHGLALLEKFPSSTQIKVLNAKEPATFQTLSLPGKVTNFQWKENFYRERLLVQFDESLYPIESENIFRVENLRATSTFLYRENEGDDWYFENKSKTMYKNNPENESIYLGMDVQKIIDMNSSRIIVQTHDALFVVSRNEAKEIKEVAANNFFYDTSRREYIAWSPWEVWTIYDNGQVALLNRMSEEIRQVLALDEAGELLIITNNKLLGFNPGYYVTREIRSDVQIQKATVDKKNRTIYFLGTWQEQRGLYKLKY